MFTQEFIKEVSPPQYAGGDMLLSWTATESGLTFQVYINRNLSWHGTATRCHLPWPIDDIQIDIGSVDPSEATTDFGATLPVAPTPHRRVELTWQGGTFLGTMASGDVKGFRVYSEDTPGSGIDYDTPLADVPAYTAGIVTDGFGYGGFGEGGFGMAAGDYAWTSSPLSSGTWAFAVRAYDAAGNEGDPRVVSVTIIAPPEPPAPFSGTMDRLHYTVLGFGQTGFGGGGFGLPEVTLTWLTSPTASL